MSGRITEELASSRRSVALPLVYWQPAPTYRFGPRRECPRSRDWCSRERRTNSWRKSPQGGSLAGFGDRDTGRRFVPPRSHSVSEQRRTKECSVYRIRGRCFSNSLASEREDLPRRVPERKAQLAQPPAGRLVRTDGSWLEPPPKRLLRFP